MSTETWKDITEFEGAYQVSDLGQVRSLPRRVRMVSKRGLECERFVDGRILRANVQKHGYLGVQLGAGNSRLIHRLVAEAFLGGKPGMQVNHKNGRRSDNRLVNLEWLSCGDNHRHSYAELDRKPHALTKRVQIRGGGETLRFESCLAASTYLGVSAGSVASAATRQHRCKGFEVTYV